MAMRAPMATLLFLLAAPALRAADAPPAAPDALAPRESSRSKDDPRADGWRTEVFTNAANAQLKALSKLLEHPEMRDLAHAEPLVHPSFQCGPLRPSRLAPAFLDGPLSVARQAPAGGRPALHRGAAGLLEAIAEAAAPFHGATSVRTKLKLYKVEPGDGTVTTRQYVAIYGRREGEAREHNALWVCRWTDAADGPPRLLAIDVSDHEEAVAPAPLFTEMTGNVLGSSPAAAQLAKSADRFWGTLDASLEVDPNGYSGLAVGDVDGDGRDDVYLCETGGLPNRLLIQNEDGTVTDRAAAAGVDFLDRTRSALIVDLDGDADRDLVLAMSTGVVFLANDGAARFSLRGEARPVDNAFSLAAADYDGDGDLDVYACRYYGDAGAGPIPLAIPYHDASNGGRNALLRNDGGFRFTDVTDRVGLDHNNTKFSFAASWEDDDDDGDPDLYVANDFGRNNLYRNDGGRFVDVAAAAGVEDIAAGMGVAWGDANGDGRMDLHVSNMFSSAGNRITFQGQFKGEADAAVRAQYQRHARGDSLFLNRGDGTFADASERAGITMGRWAWGSLFSDVNGDGREDIVVTNGYISNTEPDDL